MELAQHNVEVLLHELFHRSERPKPYAGAGAAGRAGGSGEMPTLEEVEEGDEVQAEGAGATGDGGVEGTGEGEDGAGTGHPQSLPEDFGGRICFVTGDLKAALKKQKSAFDAIAVSNRYATIVKEDIEGWVRAGTRLVVENADYMVELKADHSQGFLERVEEMAAGKWERVKSQLPSSQMLFSHV